MCFFLGGFDAYRNHIVLITGTLQRAFSITLQMASDLCGQSSAAGGADLPTPHFSIGSQEDVA
jgi:hypothetical protein